jgi:hypothetical protein
LWSRYAIGANHAGGKKSADGPVVHRVARNAGTVAQPLRTAKEISRE